MTLDKIRERNERRKEIESGPTCANLHELDDLNRAASADIDHLLAEVARLLACLADIAECNPQGDDGYDAEDADQASALCALASIGAFSAEILACGLKAARLAEAEKHKAEVARLTSELAAVRDDTQTMEE